MLAVLFLFIAVVLFALAAFAVPIPHLPHPGWLALALVTLVQLWPLMLKASGG
jgi:hypothetical protein